MMKGRSGEVLWDDTIRLGIELRKKLRAIRREFDTDAGGRPIAGSSTPSCRITSSHDGEEFAWEDLPTDLLASRSRACG